MRERDAAIRAHVFLQASLRAVHGHPMTEDAGNPSFAKNLLFEYIALTNVLDRDVVSARAALLDRDTQFARRQFVRTVVADIEATVGSMIHIALRMHRGQAEPFTPAEYAMLQERVVELRDAEIAFEPTAKLTTAANIRFAFSVFTRAVQSEFAVPDDDLSWSGIMRAIEIRDRITLPRSPKDLEITDEEIRIVHDADVWFDERCAAAMKHAGRATQAGRTA